MPLPIKYLVEILRLYVFYYIRNSDTYIQRESVH